MKRLACIAALVGSTAVDVAAQSPAAKKPIQDNSFLLEEAYNQEPAVIQHISSLMFDRTRSNWQYAFTEEIPVRGQRNQFSFTIPLQNVTGVGTGMGNIALNWRYQLVGSGETQLAVTPRLSFLLPTTSLKFGGGEFAVQGALASSYVPLDRVVLHTNAGFTVRPGVKTTAGSKSQVDFNAGQSLILLVHQRLNLMLEGTLENEEFGGSGGSVRTTGVTISPGFRWSHDLPSGLQIVPGVAFPLGFRANDGQRGVLMYISFEHEFAPLKRP